MMSRGTRLGHFAAAILVLARLGDPARAQHAGVQGEALKHVF